MGERFDSFSDLGKIAGSSRWREDVAHYMQALLRHAEKTYPEHLSAYIIGCGKTTEWFDCSCGDESIYRLEGFRRYMNAHGKTEPADNPARSVRYHGSRDFDDIDKVYGNYRPDEEFYGLKDKPSGMFRIPKDDSLAIDFWKFTNESIAGTVECMIKKAREVVRPEA